MKTLYAIQGTGNGHLSRARDIIPILKKKQLDLDILMSGTQADIQIPHPIKFQLKGWSFIFGKKGGVDVWRTFQKTNSARLQKEIKSIPVSDYDLIINDFEPVSAWASKLKQKQCVALSHQSAVLSPNAPMPKKPDPFGKMILQNYAPSTKRFGLHFKGYEENIFTPIIREDIRNVLTKEGGHYTVYLPSYSDKKIINVLSKVKGINWEIFSKHNHSEYVSKNIRIQRITNEGFVQSMATSCGILCGAGFETPAEALYMKKKLLVIPMKGQFEQQCNAAALQEMGVPLIKSLKIKHLDQLKSWVEDNSRVEVDYPNITESIIDQILEESV